MSDGTTTRMGSILREARKGNFAEFPHLADWANGRPERQMAIGITTGELASLDRKYAIHDLTLRIERCRNGQYDCALGGLVRIMDEYRITPEEIGGTTRETLQEYEDLRTLETLREIEQTLQRGQDDPRLAHYGHCETRSNGPVAEQVRAAQARVNSI